VLRRFAVVLDLGAARVDDPAEEQIEGRPSTSVAR